MHTGRKFRIHSGLKFRPVRSFAAHFDLEDDNDAQELWWCVSVVTKEQAPGFERRFVKVLIIGCGAPDETAVESRPTENELSLEQVHLW